MLQPFKLVPRRLALAISAATLSAFPFVNVASAAEVEEIQVTGSRINRDVGFESPQPVTALVMDELRIFDPGLGVSQQLENLPQFFNNVSSDNIANRVGADVGQSQLNMRGMGGGRTLVLLDGLRIVPSDRRSSPSVDYLPSTLMQRVDVVTGGASAAYGADALAGVTNFILNRNYTGLELRSSTGINEEGDGEFARASVTWGDDFMDGRLHVFGTLEQRINDGFRRENADWDKRQNYVRNPQWAAWVAANPTQPVRSAPYPQRLTSSYVYANGFTSTGLILTAAGSALHRRQFTHDGTAITPFQEGTNGSMAPQTGQLGTTQGAPGQYQYDEFVAGHPQSFERLGVDQRNGLIGADFNLTERTTVWGHFLYGRSTNNTEPATSGASGVGLGHAGLAYMTIFRDNPYLPASVRQTMVSENRQSIRVDQHGYLGTDWGIRESTEVVNQLESWTVGFNTELGGDWNLRGAYQTGDAKKHNELNNAERLDRFYLATDAVTDPVTNQPICRIQLVARQLAAQGRNLEQELHAWSQVSTSPSRYFFRSDFGATTPGKPEPVNYPIAVDSIDNTISDCIPVNMFGRGQQSDAAMDYIFSGRTKTGISTQWMDFAELLATGTIMEGWAGPISGAVGATWRDSSIKQFVVDDAIDSLGAPCNVTLPDGIVVVRGIAPAINCSATADSLHRFSGQPEFIGGYDVSELFAESVVPLYQSASGEQNAELNVAARWSDYSRAGEFVSWKAGLTAQVFSDLRLRGTLSHDIREGSFEELFVQQGRGANITDPVTGQTYTTFNLTGGNPDLEAEEADTTVFGFVYQPSFIEGLSLSVDRYDVDLSSAIGSFTEQQTVDECQRSGVLCDMIIRGTDGLIQTIRVQFVNINAARVNGYDFEVSYRMEPDFFSSHAETMSLRFLAGRMIENSTTPLNGTKLDSAGTFTLPENTMTANLFYNVGNLGISLQQTHQSDSIRNAQWVEGIDVDDNTIGSVNLTNLGLFWNGEASSGTWRASFNVTNLFDRAPVIAGTTRTGDELGRRYAVGFDYSFN
jgi:outer membrane receptor protein involved in Fe transport